MAFPSVQASATSAKTSASTNHTVNLPSGISAGDLLVVLFVVNNGATITWPSGWTQIIGTTLDGLSEVTIAVRRRIADGSEGSTITIQDNLGLKSCAISLRITGHDGTSPIATGAATASGQTASPNPPNCNASTAQDYLWIEGFGADDDDDTATYWSTNYTGIAQAESDASSTSVSASIAYRQLNASAENPGTMSMAASEEWVAFTFAVAPAAAADNHTSAIPLGAITTSLKTPGAATTERHYVALPAGALATTGNAPGATTTEKHFVSIPKGEISTSAKTPSATVTERNYSAIPLASLSLSGRTPGATATDNNPHTVALPLGALVLTGRVPSATISEPAGGTVVLVKSNRSELRVQHGATRKAVTREAGFSHRLQQRVTVGRNRIIGSRRSRRR